MLQHTDPRVDDYIRTLPEWQQDICQTVRQLAHQADPEVCEEIKRRIYPYFTLHGNIIALMGTKDHVNIFVYDPLAPDPDHIITQGHRNKTARAIQIHQNDKLNQPALLNLLKAIIANNRAGGWRKLQS